MMNARRNFKAAMAVCLALGFPAVGFGDTFNVNSTTDAIDADPNDGQCLTAANECTLRAAVQQANVDDALDTINVPSGTYMLTLLGDDGEFDPEVGDLDTRGSVEIIAVDGAGTVTIDGNRKSRVIEVWRGANDENSLLVGDDEIVIDGLVLINGWTPVNSVGGGIRAREGVSLTILNSTIADNRAVAYGGGVHSNIGNLTIENSIILRNKSDGMGAGIFVNDVNMLIKNSLISGNDGIHYPPGNIFGGGVAIFSGWEPARIENTLITDNEATNGGGGVYVGSGELVMVNSTVSNNLSNYNGGGIYYRSDAGASVFDSKLINVTVARNTARGIYNQKPVEGAGGGGIYVEDRAALKMQNTLVVENIGDNCIGGDSQLVSLGNNMDGDGSCDFDQTSDLPSQTVANIGDLADNGGPTATHALLAASAAIDAGNSSVCATLGNVDQRYNTRDGSCDIGAFEYNATSGGQSELPGTDQPLPPAPDNYTPPLAFWMPFTVTAGGVVEGVFSGATYNYETPLRFEVTDYPEQGELYLYQDTSNIPERFQYVAEIGASGSDYIKYKACDNYGCSEEAIIVIFIVGNEPVTGDVRMDIINDTGGTITNPTGIAILADTDVALVAPDIDYDHPLGDFFFTLDNIPEDPGGTEKTEIVINLPPEANIPEDAVVRKLDIRNEWRTLPTEAIGTNTSTAVIDHTAKTITLTLYDNDNVFDRNPVLGVIDDPVALGSPRSNEEKEAEIQRVEAERASVFGGNNKQTENDVAGGSAGDSSGGGSLSWLALFALLPLYRLRGKR